MRNGTITLAMGNRKQAANHGQNEVSALRGALLAWYRRHRRELPWRRDSDAYRVWISEIMLQQTRVAAVLEHYRLFLEAFPTVADLASSDEDRVLALWSGLGYYRRARQLRRAAQFVVQQTQCKFPENSQDLRQLPGVGRYTAAAIASIAFAEPVAVVDGNVERVLSRLDGLPRTGEAVWQRAQELLDPQHPGDWNQAMMELGATVCTPRAPQCLLCPVQSWCKAPGAETARPQPARKRLRVVCAVVRHAGRLYLVCRAADAAKMAGMWELPEVDGKASGAGHELCMVRHSITDTDYEVRVVALPLRAVEAKARRAGRWIAMPELATLPLTGLTRKVLRRQHLL